MSSPVGVPDLLAHLRMGKSQKATRQAFDRASLELATGEKSDRFKASGGDTTRLDAIERSISRIDVRQPLTGLAANRAAAAQLALGTVAGAVDTIGVDLLNSVETISKGSLDLVIKSAEQALEQTISTLNTGFGGRYLFSGAATGTAPFRSAADILTGLKDALAARAIADGAPLSLATAKDEIAKFFETSSNFYKGSATPSAPVELRDGRRLDYAVNVGHSTTEEDLAATPPKVAEKNDAIRAVLRDLATVVVLRDAKGSLDPATADATEQALYKTAGEGLLKGVSGLTDLRALLGVAEQTIEKAQAADAAERSALEQARAKIVARDPYDAATEVAQLENQLQAIYAMTARSAQLSLVNFLR